MLEMSISNTVQPLKLFREHQVVDYSIAYVFVNTRSKDLVYKNAKQRGEEAKILFEEVLQFDEVEVCEDLEKAKVLEILEKLKKRKAAHVKKIKETEEEVQKEFKKLDKENQGSIELD